MVQPQQRPLIRMVLLLAASLWRRSPCPRVATRRALLVHQLLAGPGPSSPVRPGPTRPTVRSSVTQIATCGRQLAFHSSLRYSDALACITTLGPRSYFVPSSRRTPSVRSDARTHEVPEGIEPMTTRRLRVTVHVPGMSATTSEFEPFESMSQWAVETHA